jgi:DNA polymerase
MTAFVTEKVDWPYLVSIDFETYYDTEFTLSKLSTSEYIRDPRFEVLMMGIKIGEGKTRIIPGNKVAGELKKIPWNIYSLLCHNTLFDGFILSQCFGVTPKRTYCSLSMARGLHSNDIGAGLDEVSRHYGGLGKIEDGVENMKGKSFSALFKDKVLWDRSAEYCARDVDEMFRVFKAMVPKMPKDEMDLINITNRMFIEPVLEVNIPRVEAELQRELQERKEKLFFVVNESEYDESEVKQILKTKAERSLEGEERRILFAKRVIGSNDRLAELLRRIGVEPPVKISPAWIKKAISERDEESKWTYAFAKDDQEFVNLPDDIESLGKELNLDIKDDVVSLSVRQERLRSLVEARIAVKSTTNITRAERFLVAGANGAKLPVGYAYYRAHTGRWGGTNKMNMQNLKRGGELRRSIEAPAGHVLVVVDSGQIECRVNGWLWGQDDLLDAFRDADLGTGLDAYCRMASAIYSRPITKEDKTERFVGKVCVLGLGFQMGAPKLQITLAKGALGGPPVYFELERCHGIVNTYRRMNSRIEHGWRICAQIIEDMAAGVQGSHGPISWSKETIHLPNGMALKYPDLRKRMGDKGWDEWTYQGMLKTAPIRKKIYGGLLCENIVQALARIVVATQMLSIDKKDRLVMTTHDEAVACVKERQADAALSRMLKAFRTPPTWCSDLPLNAEGGYAKDYSK